MKAIVCEKPYKLGIEERREPIRKKGEVLIRIKRVGLCGTDYHIFAGNQPFLNYPRIMGHELSGEVAEIDEGAPFKIGQLVTINPYLPCGTCIACRKAKPNCCANINVIGVHSDGGMTEFICVPASAVIAVDGLSPEQASMVEFLSVGAHAVSRGKAGPEDRVLIVGAGPIGIGVALFCQLSGAEITLIDVSASRLAYARDKLGIEAVFQVGEGLDDFLKGRTDGAYFDLVFDATGSAKAIEKGFSYVAHAGRYVLVSVVKDTITFSDPEFHKREMTLLGSRNATNDDFAYVIEAIRTKKIQTELLHTHSINMMEDPTASIGALIENQGSVLKAIAVF